MTGERDYARLLLVNRFDLSLARAAEAAAAEGIDRETIARLFVSHAHEVLTKTPGATPGTIGGRTNSAAPYVSHRPTWPALWWLAAVAEVFDEPVVWSHQMSCPNIYLYGPRNYTR